MASEMRETVWKTMEHYKRKLKPENRGWKVLEVGIDGDPKPGGNYKYFGVGNDYKTLDILERVNPDIVADICVAGDTLILTNHGWKYASEIKKGNKVVTHKGRFKTVKRVFKRKNETIKLKVANLPILEITDNHPVLSSIREYNNNNSLVFTSDWNWEKVSELVPSKARKWGSIVASLAKREFKIEKVSQNMAWMYGYYTAEGTHGGHQVSFSMNIKEKKQRKRIMKIIKSIGYKPSYREHKDLEGSVGIVYFGSPQWVEFFRKESGIKENKQIPWMVFGFPRKQKINFLEGYISGDGCCDKSGIITSSISKKISFGIWQLYRDCGFNARMGYIKNEGPIYDFKHKNGKTYKAKPQWRVILSPSESKRFLREAEIYKESAKKELGQWKSLGSQSTQTMQVKKFKGYYAHPVKKIEYGEKKDVYNFEIEEDNSYIADGIVIHNCDTKLPAKKWDLIILSQTLEHIFDFRAAIKECFRLLKSGGFLIIDCPFYYPYHGTSGYDDYWRISHTAMKKILDEVGFEFGKSALFSKILTSAMVRKPK